MKTVIGLIKRGVDPAQPLQKLKETGFAGNQVAVIREEKVVRKLLGCEPACVITRYAAWGAVIGVVIYGVFAAFAAMCQCNLLQYGQAYGIGTFVGGILAGGFVGAALGAMAGAAEYEKDSQFYVQGLRMGDQMIAVEAIEEEIENVKLILKQEKVSGLRAV